MECKERTDRVQNESVLIRIVPEWNVKRDGMNWVYWINLIRIVPEWNVKTYESVRASVQGVLESYQSGM